MTKPSWMLHAACYNVSFEEKEEMLSRDTAAGFIARYCDVCPVREQCAAERKEYIDSWGVWGGEFFPDRRWTNRCDQTKEYLVVLEALLQKTTPMVWAGKLAEVASATGRTSAAVARSMQKLEKASLLKPLKLESGRRAQSLYEIPSPDASPENIPAHTKGVWDYLLKHGERNVWIGTITELNDALAEKLEPIGAVHNRAQLRISGMADIGIIKRVSDAKTKPAAYAIREDLPENTFDRFEFCLAQFPVNKNVKDPAKLKAAQAA